MRNLVTYHQAGATATITIDDGKVNALSMQVFHELNSALDRADMAAHAATKHRARQQVLQAIRTAIEDDSRALAATLEA